MQETMQHLTPENTTWHELYDMYLKQQADNEVMRYKLKAANQQIDILEKVVYKNVK